MKNYVSTLFRKLGLQQRTAAAAYVVPHSTWGWQLGRVLEPHRLCQRLDGALWRWYWPPLSCAGTRSPYAASFTPITSVTR